MIGDRAYENAVRRRDELRHELEEIEKFIKWVHRFAGTDSGEGESSSQGVNTVNPHTRFSSNESLVAAADPSAIDLAGRASRRKDAAELLKDIRELLIEAGHPLSRRDIAQRLMEKGIMLFSKDPANYIGTVVWRSKGQFRTIEGEGYWPADVPLSGEEAKAAANPASDDAVGGEAHDSESRDAQPRTVDQMLGLDRE